MSHIRLEFDPRIDTELERNFSGSERHIKSTSRNKTYAGTAKLWDKVALITGGDTAIGRAVALLFAREGADVALVYSPQAHENAARLRDAVAAQGRKLILIPGDTSDDAFCRQAAKHTVREFDRIDILVNHAPYGHQGCFDHFDTGNIEQWNAAFKNNLHGYFNTVKAALPYLGKGACIVNTGGVCGSGARSSVFAGSQGQDAIYSFTRSLANNLLGRGIRVNCVAPGPEWTPNSPVQPLPDTDDAIHPHSMAPAEEIAPVYLFFASPVDSGHITGEVLTALGRNARTA